MLKRFSSLILALVIGSSVLAGTARPGNEHVCKMAGMGMMPGTEMMDHAAMDQGMVDHMGTMDHGSMDHGSMDLSMDHGMEMADHDGTEMMPGMETMPCCKKHAIQSVSSESGLSEQCCFNIPQETGPSGTTFNLRRASVGVVVNHPAVVQSPLAAPKPYECSHSVEVFLPNLQASYIRNLSILI